MSVIHSHHPCQREGSRKRSSESIADSPHARTCKVKEEALLLSAMSAVFTESMSSIACGTGGGGGAPSSPWDPFRGVLFDRDASTHVAAVVKRGKLLAAGTNRSGTCRGGGSFSLHAERAAVKALGDMSQLRGADLYVFRIPHSGHKREGQCSDLLYSRPCYQCTVFLEKCMRVWGLRRVLYTTDMTMALTPPQNLKEWDDSVRPPEDSQERRRWERKLKVQRRISAIRGSQRKEIAVNG